MRDFFKSGRFKLLCGILALFIIGMVIAAAVGGKTSAQSSVVGTVFHPVQQLASFVSEKIGDVFDNASGRSSYQKEIDALQDEVTGLREELVDYEKIKKQNDTYKDALGLKEEHKDFQFAEAEVISRDSADLFYSFTISKGSTSGVKVNDPVVCGKYLIGMVVKVFPTYSTVRTLLDPQFNASVYEVRSTAASFITGDLALAEEGNFRMSNLTRDTQVATGGIICTSGIGGVFPKGLLVGTVKEVKDDTVDISSYAVVQPGVDIKSVSNVFVVTHFDGQGEGQ